MATSMIFTCPEIFQTNFLLRSPINQINRFLIDLTVYKEVERFKSSHEA